MRTRHGFATNAKSRGAYAIRQGWLGQWGGANELEGGKDFPTKAIAGLDYHEDTESAAPPTDGYICSGGRTDVRDIINYTDNELNTAKGEVWPRTKVNPGQVFKIFWQYDAVHITRGYNYWITKDGWNPRERISLAQLEAVPFHKDHYEYAPWYNHKDQMQPKAETTVSLPRNKAGHHVMIVPWIVCESPMAFYQTFDLEFTNDDIEEPELEAHITPHSKTVNSGESASFAVSTTGQNERCTYLWNLPPELTVHHGGLNGNEVMYATDNITENKTFYIECQVTNSNHQSTTADATLIVKGDSGSGPGDPNPEPGECTDPHAAHFPAWSATTVYLDTPTAKVSYKGLVWSNIHYINAGENPPDIHPGWNLESNVVPDWGPKDYQAGNFVNHNNHQWKNNEWVPYTAQPGADARWVRLGESSCSPLTTKKH